MPFADYLPEHMGEATLSPAGPFVAGTHAELTLTYTAGTFGIDDTGMLKISWRTTSDMAKPQFKDPAAANYTSVEASNGAKLEYWFERLNIRPWVNTLLIRVGRGYLRKGDTITVRLGDRRQGSPGIRLQTNCEERFELKTCVDAFATYEFTELPESPAFELIAGPPASWKAIVPSLTAVNEPFRLAIVAEDMWGNPAKFGARRLVLVSSRPVQNLPEQIDTKADDGPLVIANLIADDGGDLSLCVCDADGKRLALANPMRVVAQALLRPYWGDLHAQSGETVGTNPAESYFRYARDKAFVDIVGHQGNDFQITDAFWQELNRLTAAFDVPGKFVCVPGYEWSGNTGMGGDRNIFYRREGRPIHRSSHVLTAGETSTQARYTAHDGKLERAVEVHSSWGTFEWILHDAFDGGHRVGIVCHSDDHKGRPGATRPGASTFGAIGGLTCYLMPELSRDALFDALRKRRHYGTTGPRVFMDVRAQFAAPVTVFSDDPKLGPVEKRTTKEAAMGDIVAPGRTPMTLKAEVIGTAPIEQIDVLHGKSVAATFRPYKPGELGRRIRVRWEGAEYRGRGRETLWQGKLAVDGNRIARFAPVNFLNPERMIAETEFGRALAWTSVTTGNIAGLDLWLEEARAGSLRVDTNIVSGSIDIAALGDEAVVFDGGGLGRKLMVYRLPDEDWSRHISLEHDVTFAGGADLPVYIRVTQADGNQAWSSPIYLVD